VPNMGGVSREDFKSDKRGNGGTVRERGSVPAKIGPKGACRDFPHAGLHPLDFDKGSRLLLTHNSASATSLPWLDLYASNTQLREVLFSEHGLFENEGTD